MSNSSGDILILSSNSVMFNFFKRNKENSQADTIRTDDSNECSFILFNANKIPADKQTDGLYLYGWQINDGDYIEVGKPLYLISKGKRGTLTTIFEPVLSVYSGVIEVLINEDEELKDGQSICKLHPRGKYINENSPESHSYKYHFNKHIFDKNQYRITRLKEWYKNDGDYVNKGDLLVSFCTPYWDKSEFVNHYAEKSGYLNIATSYGNLDYSIGYNQRELVYEINDTDEGRIENKFINIPEIAFDDFKKAKLIKWKQVSSIGYSTGIKSNSDDNKVTLVFTFNSIEKKDFIAFQFSKKELKLNPKDTVSFLFEDEKIIQFELKEPSYKFNHPHVDYYLENRVQITSEALNEFANNVLVKWKISSPKRGIEIIGGCNGAWNYFTQDNFHKIIQKFTREYTELVAREIEDYQPLKTNEIYDNNANTEIKDECYVYLMIDLTNNHHKIGISNKPEWREKTLQSEKPTIELIASKKFVSRKIALSIEKALHSAYSEKRIRGEWFSLDRFDINEIVKTLE